MIDIGKKLWGFCHTLKHEGISHTRYLEQITCLLFIKMADERDIRDLSTITYEERGETRTLDCSWRALAAKSGTELLEHYEATLRALGKQTGILGDIFAGAQSRFKTPVSLKKLIGLINEIEWTSLEVDVKGKAYEDLLEQAGAEGKKGAGQMFTPRLVIQSIVRCVKPDPRAHKEFKLCDPACGTGGFLVCAYEWFLDQTDGGAIPRDVAKRVRNATYFGQDIDDEPRRFALMNLYLHGIEPQIKLGDTIYEAPLQINAFDVVLTNPPFGTRGANQAPEREDFVVATSNKQLNFIQHVMSILRPGGRAAIVVPDNCLFADQAGAVFDDLTKTCDLHTVLRLPNGTFTPYSAGTKTNVIFFTKGEPTQTTWVYDGRTNVPHITKKDRPLSADHLAEFERCFGDDPFARGKRTEKDSPAGDNGYHGGNRWRPFAIAQVRERNFKIDSLKWLRDESLEDASDLPEPEELATDAISELTAAVNELKEVVVMLENGNSVSAKSGVS